jgi:hypothetical protein
MNIIENSLKQKIIGICGFIGCGKGTVGDILIRSHNFKKISFAETLKDGVAAVYGWDRKLLEGNTEASRSWRETPDEFWTKELGREITPRYVLQLFGTDCMRRGFDEQIWVLTVKRKILENPNDNFVVPDARFYNERDMLKELGGQVWRVKRGPDPEWVKEAISDNRYDTTWMKKYPKIHESEWRWFDYDSEFDRIINNEGSLEDLEKEVKKAIKS